jgi:drug/metabolite transporter (DMT)-like permease
MQHPSLFNRFPSPILIVLAFTAIYIVWGSTYIAVLIALKDIPPFLITGFRFMIAGLLLLIYSIITGQSLPRIKSIFTLSLSGILMLFFGTGAVAWVEQYISSGLAAIIVATVPLWFVLLDRRQWNFYFSNKLIIAGLLIGFGGVMILFADKKSLDFSGDKMKLLSFFIMLAGAVCWASGSLFLKYKSIKGSTVIKAAIQMIAAGIVFFVISIITGELQHTQWQNISHSSVLSIIYLVVAGSLVGYMSYVWLLSVRSAALVGTYAYVNPVVAVFLGWLIADEQIVSRQVLALAVILAGVILVTLAKEKK